ncbi:glycerol-3-phosphate O-acyltransferase [Hortaea werneckii]|nr:glycerol-3-phosphate O-acyltransferase [Hortaea werneckii]
MPSSTNTSTTPKGTQRWNAITYDIFLWVFTIVTDLFFREIHPRSSWRVPRKGPVIFVAAPHANQFVDPLMLMRTVRHDAKRRIAFLIAEKSMRRPFVGFMAGLVQSVSVGRALDSKKPAQGKIYLPDPENDPTLVHGRGTHFTDESLYMQGGLLVLPSVNNTAANAEIAEVVSQTAIRLKKPFKGEVALKQLTGQDIGQGNGHLPDDCEPEKSGEEFEGTSFNVAPHVDQSAVYDAVFKRIREGGCIGIFPEGGSHDRTELLPLKAGLAVMALGALAEDPNCGVTIVPVGMNYFHAHKFRSRAVVEFGAPIEIEPRLVEQYKSGDRRGATGEVLNTVYDRLTAVTTLAPDYDTLMLIQAVRRLYNPKGKRLPLPMVVELNRRLMKGYAKYKDDPRVVSLRQGVLDYNKTLFRLNIRDHQVSYAKFSWYKVVVVLVYRIMKLVVLAVAVLPGTVLFAPVFIAGKVISRIKAKEALAASTVKVQARDVMATWKILVSLALAPALDVFYTIILTWWTAKNRVRGWVPEFLPVWLVMIGGLFFFPAVCFAALRFGEIGMDIFKSIRPLVLSLNPTSSNSLVKLRARRAQLQEQINDIINELGPELFPDFDRHRIVTDPDHPLYSSTTERASRPRTLSHGRNGSGEFDALTFTPATPPARDERQRRSNIAADGLPRNESMSDISKVGFFASRPSTPNDSRSRTNSSSEGGSYFHRSAGLGFSPMEKSSNGGKVGAGRTGMKASGDGGATTGSDMDEVSRNLHAAMRERGRRRRSEVEYDGVGEKDGMMTEEEEEEQGEMTPGSTGSEEGMVGRKGV